MSRPPCAHAEDERTALDRPLGATPPASGVRASSEASEMAERCADAIVGGRYRLLRRIGRGGMGEVWCAEHVVLRVEVAIKVPAMHVHGAMARIARERFRFEAQVAARLGAETPHVVAALDAGDDDAGPFLAMEYVRGATLRELVEQRGPLPIDLVATIVEQTAEALSAAHAYGVAHRDLKPANVLVAERRGAPFVKLADFGVAKALRADLAADVPEDTASGLVIGSPAYMSPEQICGAPAAASGDLWALAVVAYEALTGGLPFDGRSYAHIFVGLSNGRFVAASARRPALPTAVDAWFARALARDPAERFASPGELARALRAAAQPEKRAMLGRLAARIGALARGDA